MSDESPADLPPVMAAWSEALPRVLALLGEQQSGPFRQELQRYLAATRFQPNDVREYSERLKKLLVEAARAAAQPAAIHMTRELSESDELAKLCEHLLACWRDAEATTGQRGACGAMDGLSGDVFFGPRLGGTGRPGAVRNDGGEEPDDPPS